MIKSLKEKESEIADRYEGIDDPMMKYEQLMEEGQNLMPMPEIYKTEHNLVKGCQSKVWLFPEMRDGLIYYWADSNTQITKGLVAILVELCNGRNATEIAAYDFEIVNRIGLQSMLSSQRSNGLKSMIGQMKLYAQKMVSN